MTKAIKINQSLNYQDGAVVSKEIVKKSSGTITLFAFDRGQGLSEHTTPYDALVMVTDGSLEITISGAKHKVGAGEMILMPANSPHALKAITPFKMILVMIKS